MANTKDEVRDRRAQRTRQALLRAFFGLVLERRYDEIKVADILKRAGVGRSTFYEHFPNKDGILAGSLHGPFGILADASRETDNTADLVRLLEHFWTNRAVARGIFLGAARRKTVAVLVELIEQGFEFDGIGKTGVLQVPARLVAIQLAESLLGPVTAWLTGEVRCSVEVLALALRRTAVAMVAALRQPR